MRKSPKNLPEGYPLWVLPLGGIIIPPAARRAAPPRKGRNSGRHAIHKLTAAPRINSRGCDSRCSLGRKQGRFALHLKVANRAGLVAETLSRGWRQRRRGSEASPSGGPGAQPRHAFGSFRRETKGTPGVGRVGPLMGRSEEPSLTTCSRRGAAPPRIGGCRDYVLAEIPGPCTHKPRPSPIYMSKKPFLRREPV